MSHSFGKDQICHSDVPWGSGFLLPRMVGSQTPEEFMVGSTAFKLTKCDCIHSFLHLKSWWGICWQAVMGP